MKLTLLAFALALTVPLGLGSVHGKGINETTTPTGGVNASGGFGFYCSAGACEASANASVYIWSGTGTGAVYPRVCGTTDFRCEFTCHHNDQASLAVTAYDSNGGLLGSASAPICTGGGGDFPVVPFGMD